MRPGNREAQNHPGGTQQLSGERPGVAVDNEIDESVRPKQFVELDLLATDNCRARCHKRCTSDVVDVVVDAHVKKVARVKYVSLDQTVFRDDSLDRRIVGAPCDLGKEITGEHSDDTRVIDVFWLRGRDRR
jgi:hypothetical protein